MSDQASDSTAPAKPAVPSSTEIQLAYSVLERMPPAMQAVSIGSFLRAIAPTWPNGDMHAAASMSASLLLGCCFGSPPPATAPAPVVEPTVKNDVVVNGPVPPAKVSKVAAAAKRVARGRK